VNKKITCSMRSDFLPYIVFPLKHIENVNVFGQVGLII